MTREEMRQMMEQVFSECQELRGAGQKEYAHSEDNAFSNFERTGAEIHVPREKVLYIFAKKHIDGVVAYMNGHKSQREDVRGRINDLIVYLCLLRGMIEEDETVESHRPLPRFPDAEMSESRFDGVAF